MTRSPQGRSRKATKGKKPRRKNVTRSEQLNKETRPEQLNKSARSVSVALEDGFILAFKRIVQRIASIKSNGR